MYIVCVCIFIYLSIYAHIYGFYKQEKKPLHLLNIKSEISIPPSLLYSHLSIFFSICHQISQQPPKLGTDLVSTCKLGCQGKGKKGTIPTCEQRG